MLMQTRAILTKARELVTAGWTQSVNAVDENDEEVTTSDSTACKFCVYGAIFAASQRLGYAPYSQRAVDAFSQAMFGNVSGLIAGWNDAPERTQADVVAAFDKAIAEAGQ